MLLEEVAEALDDLLGVVDLALELDRVLDDELGGGEDGGLGAHRQGEGVAGARVDVDLGAVLHQRELGVEGAVLELGDGDARDLGLELADDVGEQVVRHRPRQLGALQLDEDGGGLGVADPDGQELVALQRLEQDDRLLADDVEADAVDDHLLDVHGALIIGHRHAPKTPARMDDAGRMSR